MVLPHRNASHVAHHAVQAYPLQGTRGRPPARWSGLAGGVGTAAAYCRALRSAATAAPFLPIAWRSSAVNASARARPPARPPARFDSSMYSSSASPVASLATCTAFAMTLPGRFSPCGPIMVCSLDLRDRCFGAGHCRPLPWSRTVPSSSAALLPSTVWASARMRQPPAAPATSSTSHLAVNSATAAASPSQSNVTRCTEPSPTRIGASIAQAPRRTDGCAFRRYRVAHYSAERHPAR